MNAPSTAREVLILEALGEAARLIQQVEDLVPTLEQSRESLTQARIVLAQELRSFEQRLSTLTERARADTVMHIVARTDEAARRSIDDQRRAMADAARLAFGAELGATGLRLQGAVETLLRQQTGRWERWLTHVAVAAGVAMLTWALTALARGC